LRPANNKGLKLRAFRAALRSHSNSSGTDDDARLRRRQRAALVETLRELANLAAGALVLGQFVGPQPLSVRAVFGGLASWLTIVGAAVLLTGEE